MSGYNETLPPVPRLDVQSAQVYDKKRMELLDRCAYGTYDLSLQVQCDCLNTLDAQSRAFDNYARSVANYNRNYADWAKFDSKYGYLSQRYTNLKKDLDAYRLPLTWTCGLSCGSRVDGTDVFCNPYAESGGGTGKVQRPELETVPGSETGGVTAFSSGGSKQCRYTEKHKEQELAKFRRENNLPDAKYKPAPVPPFNPGNVMCCQQAMQNIQVSGALQFDGIKQQCQSEISQNISALSQTNDDSSTPSTPSTPSTSSTPSTTSTSSTTSTTSSSVSRTVWIIVGVVLAVFVILGAIALYRSKNYDDST